ncbi:hypothetical protein HMPREF0216_03390 [Clostridium celatum DSM 1785]|uniref:Uncharacterized protein n=2 Tax=Clostridium celatum TaxID=36834 RepID=L1Q2X4_9CLOT|nr:hypothetical protein HMPREF0216_03390 [Clostridium celatum DSM 1785]
MEEKIMDWYCAVWNSDAVSSAAGAQVLYEMLCEGNTTLVGDIDIIDEFYEDLISKKLNITADKGKGFVIIGCMIEDAEYLNDLVQSMVKAHGLSYYEPQNITYIF